MYAAVDFLPRGAALSQAALKLQEQEFISKALEKHGRLVRMN